MKKAFFHLLALSMSLLIGLVGAEIIIRIQEENGPRRAWTAFIEGEVPISYGGDDQRLVADPVLAFRYNSKFPKTNSLGLRNGEITRAKPAGRERVIILGDSVSALCNDEPNTEDVYVNVLQDRWKDKAEIINAAVIGYTVHQQRLLLETVLIDYEPDLVIVQYTLNDNTRFLNRWYVESVEGQGLKNTEAGTRTMLVGTSDPLSWLPDGSYVATRLRMALVASEIAQSPYPWKRAPGFNLAWVEQSWALLEQELGLMKKLADQVDADLLIVAVPFGPQLNPKLLAGDREYVLKPQRLLGEVCARLDIEVKDLFEDFHAVDGERFFYDMIHMDEKGHEVVTAALNAYFEKRFPEESGETDR